MPPEGGTGEAAMPSAALEAFGRHLGEVAVVVAESVLDRRWQVGAGTLRPTTAEDLIEEFGGLRHGALELRVALSPSEAHLATVLLPEAALAAALALDPSLDDAALRGALRTAAKDPIDLLSLMLFTDSPVRGEITVSDVRVGEIEVSVGMVADTSAGAPLYRLDATLSLGSASGVVTVLVPQTLLSSLDAALGGGDAASPAEPRPAAAARAAERAKTAEPTAKAAAPGTAKATLKARPAGGGAGMSRGRAGDREIPAEPEAEDEDDGERVAVLPLQFPTLRGGNGAGTPQALDLILDVTMRVSVELGRALLTVQEILALGPGSVLELDKLAGEPVDILVNDRPIARGEVVMVDENFGVRVTEILTPGPRAQPREALA